jgi:hypothetical protein
VIGKYRPPWISDAGVAGLLLQFFVAGLLIYAVLGVNVGWLHPKGNPPSLSVQLATATWAMTAFAAGYAIYRNLWWGYFLELLVCWSLIWAALLLPKDEVSQPGPEPLIIWHTVKAVLEWLCLLWFTWNLGATGLRRWNEQRTRAVASSA